MAGRKQHFIPQSLLRGFEASRTGKKSQVVVYKRGEEAFVTSTEGIAAQRHFYSTPSSDGTETLDDLVTNFEKEHFNPILYALRDVGSGDVDRRSAATAVVHLAVRAAHLRGSLATIGLKMVDHFGIILNDGDATRDFAGVDSDAPDSRLAREVAQTLDALPADTFSPKDKLILGQMVRFRVREKFEDLIPAAMPLLRNFVSGMGQALPSVVQNSHVRILEDSLAPEARVTALMELHWQVIALEDPDHYILPDCVAVASAKGSYDELEPYAMGSIDNVALVAMPISSTQVLIGSRDNIQLDARLLNAQFARCSLDFFVSSRTDQHTDTVAKEIGTKTNAIAEALIEEDSRSEGAGGSERSSPASDIEIRFLPGGADREAEIEAAIRSLFVAQCSHHESDRLESIVVTADVARAVSELRGRPLTPKELQEIGLGSVEVVGRDDMTRICVVIPSAIAATLPLPKDTHEHKMAAYIVKYTLGRVTYLDQWIRWSSQKSPLTELSPQQNLRLEFVSRFASHYFGARVAPPQSTHMAAGDGSIILAQAVAGTLSALETIRKEYWAHRSIDRLASQAFATVDMLLCTAATTCGVYASQGLTIPITSSAGHLLVQHELWDWFRLLKRDLQRHFDALGRWDSIEEALGLAAHADRILWQFGILVSESPEGQVWIDICDDDKLAFITRTLLKADPLRAMAQ